MRKPRVSQFFSLSLMSKFKRRPPVILVNGLAEQSESWNSNRPDWSKNFDIKVPELLVYNGDALHKHIEAGGEGSSHARAVGWLGEAEAD